MTTILTGDSREKLKELEDESIDALVTDPPYLINFMGKDWDKENSPAADASFWEEVLRVMKPGAHGLVFGHSRQHHRVMTALEDAGFEIRDCLMWLYGQGFPKSHNIGKAVDKLQGNQRSKVAEKKQAGAKFKTWSDDPEQTRWHNQGFNDSSRTSFEVTKGNSDWEGWGTALKPAYEPIIMIRKPLAKKHTIAKNVLAYGVGGINIDASRIGTDEDFSNVKPRKMMSNQGSVKTDDHDHTASDTWKAAKDKLQNLGRFPANVLLSHHPDCKQVGEGTETIIGGNKGKSGFAEGYESGDFTKTESSYPIHECVDDCAVKVLDEQSGITKSSSHSFKATDYAETETATPFKRGNFVGKGDKGGASRFFKCVDDCPVKVLDEQAPKTGQIHGTTGKEPSASKTNVIYNDYSMVEGKPSTPKDNLAGASRFFYCAKVGKKERNAGSTKNTHPTVKPVKLMTYLAKLITPPGGKVLDPFMGSGSTGMACAMEGFDFVGIDMDEDYVEISKARIEWARTQKENE